MCKYDCKCVSVKMNAFTIVIDVAIGDRGSYAANLRNCCYTHRYMHIPYDVWLMMVMEMVMVIGDGSTAIKAQIT